ncbi:MAG: hypothetical protein ACRYFS_20945 [Janthinobacterium lividum]
MKIFTRLTAALGLVALVAATAFAQAPTSGTPVKGYTKTLKSGKTVAVKGYTRKPMMAPKTTAVKGYTKTLKSGKTVSVKGYSRKASMKKTAPKPTM